MNTEKDLLKKLGVRVIHKTLHLRVWHMTQDPEEPIRAFCSRLVGTADLCDLTVECSSSTCTHRTSYSYQVVLQALLKWMHHADIRTRVLSRSQNNELSKLSEIVDYVAAEEASLSSFSTLQSPHTIAAQSSYKQVHRQQQETPPNFKCRYCGSKHPGHRSVDSRKEH